MQFLEVSQEILFPESYPYLSGSTRILCENFAKLNSEIETIILRNNVSTLEVKKNIKYYTR